MTAKLLTGPLTTLAADAQEQAAYLSGRAQEPDLSDVDVVQELLERFDEAVDLAQGDLDRSPVSRAAVELVGAALRVPGLGQSMEFLATDPAWAAIRVLAKRALETLAKENLIAEAIPFRLFPPRFAPILEPIYGPVDGWLAIVLSRPEFDHFTAAWEAQIPSSELASKLSVRRIHKAARAIYRLYPEILQALQLAK